MRLCNHDLQAFRRGISEELQKEADLHSALGGAGALGGVGLAAGALGGAALGGVRKYRQAREEGEGVGHSLMAGAGGAIGSAQKGALIGGGLGLGAGALGGHLSSGKMDSIRQAVTNAGGGVGSAARFGQRQVHALTGWTPGQHLGAQGDARTLRSIGAGAAGAESRLTKAKDVASKAWSDDHSSVRGIRKAVGEVGDATKGYHAAEKAEQMGLTSIPGYAKSIKDNGLGKTLSTGFKEQWHSMSPAWKAMMIGAPLAEAASAAHGPEQEGGPGKGERIAKGLAGAALGSVTGSIPITTGSLLLGPAAGRAAGAVGRGVDRLRGRTPPRELQGQHYTPVETSGAVTPLERHMQESGGGSPREMGGGE